MQTLRELHKDERRGEILRAARDLVAEGGIDALTMRSVADRARVSVPTIYNLIGNRAQVLAALMDAGGDQLADLLDGSSGATGRPLDARDPLGALVAAAEALTAVVAPNGAVVAAVLADGITDPLGGDGVFARFRAATLDALVAARATGLVERSTDPELLTDRCVALAGGAVIAWATLHHDEDRLRDELAHGSLLVLAACVTDGERARVRRELDRRARRLVRNRNRTRRAGAPAAPVRSPRPTAAVR